MLPESGAELAHSQIEIHFGPHGEHEIGAESARSFLERTEQLLEAPKPLTVVLEYLDVTPNAATLFSNNLGKVSANLAAATLIASSLYEVRTGETIPEIFHPAVLAFAGMSRINPSTYTGALIAGLSGLKRIHGQRLEVLVETNSREFILEHNQNSQRKQELIDLVMKSENPEQVAFTHAEEFASLNDWQHRQHRQRNGNLAAVIAAAHKRGQRVSAILGTFHTRVVDELAKLGHSCTVRLGEDVKLEYLHRIKADNAREDTLEGIFNQIITDQDTSSAS
jgi:hypothetical protein